ncbi:uncharacterized protein BX664DRAFT_338917 [Halteromyces radiatus]|uniref:uncharacterized protein n=1 Tax=Halteromyces radiatus TaxID=101107 RepID=UPI00222079D4|nr:uncharacterized protein BX664DRAFT_338917 [Halteromyces radiatus]KAI8082720.1 hypothetical protein BX664DRAFT_338917 [Halteromyces radiatus]
MDQLSFSVTGPPSKHHWKPDSEAAHCEYQGCATSFGLFERRHHCRRCGDIFCTQHCSSYFRLDQDCQFHSEGILSRGCDHCTTEYLAWTKMEEERQQRRLQQKKRRPSSLSKKSPNSSPSEQSSTTSPTFRATQLQKQSSPKKPSFAKRQPGIISHQVHTTEEITEPGKDNITATDASSSKSIAINNNQKDKKLNNTVFSPIPSVPADWQWSTF